jgi:hypothetical protein
MLRRYLAIVGFILLFLPSLSFAEGIVASVRGTALLKKAGEEWRLVKEGEAVSEGTTVWIGASSSMVLKVNSDLIELSGGPEGQDITIVKLSPFEITGKGVSVRYLGPPAPPELLSPVDKFRSLDGRIELAWSPSAKEALYRIQISDTPDFKKMILDEKNYNTDKKVEGLGTGRFYWRVSAINRDGLEGKFSEARSFGIKPLPDPPSLTPPASTKTSTTFRWKRGSEEERYHLQISRDKEFSEIIIDLKSIEGPRVTVGMMEEGDYLVRVGTIDEEGFEGRFSEPIPFYVGPKVPSTNIGPLMIIFGVAFMLLGL